MALLYIAYGSNSNKKQMRERCQYARPLGKFLFQDARLVFRGVADLEYVPGAATPCSLWAIQKADEAALDVYEGVEAGMYFKVREIEIEFRGKKRRPLIYLMNHGGGIYPPSQEYVDTIRRGYRDFGMDESYLDDAIARSFHDKQPDDQTIARRLRQRNSRKHRELVRRPASCIPSLFSQPQPKETT